MRSNVGLLGLFLLLAPSVLAQGNNQNNNPAPTTRAGELPNINTITNAPNGPTTTAEEEEETSSPTPTETEENEETTTSRPSATQTIPDAIEVSDTTTIASTTTGDSTLPDFTPPSNLPTIAGVGIPQVGVPETANAPYMQKSDLPDGTVFICVGAALGFFGAAVLAWRGLVAWSLHRSVKRAAMAQNLADLKAMSAVPGGKKRGMYNVVNANSNMSLDRLSAAPTGHSRPPKPFAGNQNSSTPPKSGSSLFFSPTAGGARDSIVNRSSSYLPAGYYPTGNAQPAQGSPMTHVGGSGPHLSTPSLATPGNRFSARSGISPPASPSLPPSRGYDRAPPSRDGYSIYNRNSVATLGTPQNRGMYGQGNPSQLSLGVPGGATDGGRAPSAYLEDLFENHGNGPRERF